MDNTNELKVGDEVQTPRFLTVRIAAMFENVELAESCGFTGPTHVKGGEYHILGKRFGENCMIFAAAKRTS